MLIPFLKLEKKKKRGKIGKKKRSFLVGKTPVFLISTQCLSSLPPNRTQDLLPVNMKIAGLALPGIRNARERSTDNS